MARESKPGDKEQLQRELRALIKQVDEEGLRFLIRQAQTIVHNMQVDELNRSRAAAATEQGDDADDPGTTAGKPKGKKKEKTEGPRVFFEPGRRSGGYILQVDGVRSIMDEAEVIELVRIAQKASSAQTAKRQLYRWLEANRDDILMEVDLKPGGARMAALYDRLQQDFAIRG